VIEVIIDPRQMPQTTSASSFTVTSGRNIGIRFESTLLPNRTGKYDVGFSVPVRSAALPAESSHPQAVSAVDEDQ